MTKPTEVDAVQMVRDIRDRLYEQTKDMTSEELIDFYNRRGTAVREQALREIEERSSPPSKGR